MHWTWLPAWGWLYSTPTGPDSLRLECDGVKDTTALTQARYLLANERDHGCCQERSVPQLAGAKGWHMWSCWCRDTDSIWKGDQEKSTRVRGITNLKNDSNERARREWGIGSSVVVSDQGDPYNTRIINRILNVLLPMHPKRTIPKWKGCVFPARRETVRSVFIDRRKAVQPTH